MRDWFDGYALAIPFLWGNAVAQALLAVPSSIASRRSEKAGFVAWVITLVLLIVAVALCLVILPMPFGGLLTILVIGPQAMAYPLTRRRPLGRILVAFGIGVAFAVAWIVAGSLSGATPD